MLGLSLAVALICKGLYEIQAKTKVNETFDNSEAADNLSKEVIMGSIAETKNLPTTKTYSYSEVIEASRNYFKDDLPAQVFANKYALRDNDNNYYELTPDDMHDRLANEFARIDAEKYGLVFDERQKIYRNSLNQFSRIVPQGSPMAAIGNNLQLMSASNCVVIESPEDSIAGIMKAGTDLAQLMKRRAGVGIDISTLRPEGLVVNNAARTTSGAWSFADFFSYITRMIAQNGRRGALMITISVHHPDVIKFSQMKNDKSKVTGANVSIRLSDEFLKAVEADETYEQRWPEKNPTFTKQVKARDVWNSIITNATKHAEPGLIFWDKMTKFLPAEAYPRFKSVATNPCSEIPLSPFDSCRLISINVIGYVRKAFTSGAYFDWIMFEQDVRTAVQMCDNLVDLELELIEKIKSMCGGTEEKKLWQKLWEAGHEGRRTGIGLHGLGDMLAQLTIKYDTEDALKFIGKLEATLRDTAYDASTELAKVRGTFPAFDWELEKENDYIKTLPKDVQVNLKKHGRRNIALLTHAPTGSVSIVSKCGEFNRFNISSGMEPVFRNSYIRRKRINPSDVDARCDFRDDMGDCWQEFPVFHPNITNYLEKIKGFDLSKLEENTDLQKKLKDEKLPDYFVASDEIDWRYRVKLQGKAQYYLDHSISSTINLPKETTVETVGNIYLEGWKQGLKGVTVYIDGSRSGVLITNKDKDETGRPTKITRTQAPKRPESLPCDIHHVTYDGKKWTVVVGLLADEPYEVFMGYSKDIDLPEKSRFGKLKRSGRGVYSIYLNDSEIPVVKDVINSFDNPQFAWATRLISMSLRHGTPTDFIVEQLGKEGKINDLNKVIARVFKKYIKDGEVVKSKNVCPSCKSSNFIYEGGCPTCKDCGYSKCT